MKNLLLVCEAKLALSQSANEADRESGLIEARVTTWGAREGADGRKFNYQPKPFMEWAAGFAESGKPLPMFLNHNDMGMPVGEWNSFEFDDDGMTAKGRFYMNTVGGSDLYKVLKESPNMFGGVSVGAYAEQACWVDEDGNELEPGHDGTMYTNPEWEAGNAYFQITKGGLMEVSVVMYPNNPKAEIQKLEFFRPDGSANLKVLESALRDAGLGRKDAVAAASIFKRVMELRDAPADKPENAPEQSESVPEATTDALLAALEARELVAALSQRI